MLRNRFLYPCFLFLIIYSVSRGFRYIRTADYESIRLGGISDVDFNQNIPKFEELSRFAVEEHNKNENALLEFVRLVKAQEQLVAGLLYYLTLETIDEGKKKIYEAKVWIQPWLNFKELVQFRNVGDGGRHEAGWRRIPTHDPIVRDAADHFLKVIQQKSNCIYAYELVEIERAKAEVIDDFAKLKLLLKLKLGAKEEIYMVELHKKSEGTFMLKHMQQEQ